MRYVIDIYGVLVPALLLWIIIAYVLSALLRRIMQRFDLYRLVWTRALFDFAVFVFLLGGVVYLSEYLS